MVLAGEHDALAAARAGRIDQAREQRAGHALPPKAGQHVQAEHGLVRAAGPVQRGVVVELVRQGRRVGGAAVDKAHDRARRLGHEEILREGGKPRADLLRARRLRRGEAGALDLDERGDVSLSCGSNDHSRPSFLGRGVRRAPRGSVSRAALRRAMTSATRSGVAR